MNTMTDNHYATTDGIGLWNLWRRNFRSPMLALLDLVDNCLDAALSLSGGAVDAESRKNYRGKVHFVPDRNAADDPTGICVINNCATKPKHIDQVFAVARSVKTGAQIGENGVGLKQACATLANLSIVLMRDHNDLSVGILARHIQKPDGPYLPRFVFSGSQDIRSQMMQEFRKNSDVESCIKMYGDGFYEAGVDRLMKAYFQLKNPQGPWASDPYVFCLILHQPTSTLSTSSTISFPDGDLPDEQVMKFNANNFLDNLKKELPMHYLHIGEEAEIKINMHRIRFDYWQSRLVELTRCDLIVDPKHLFTDESTRKFESAKGYQLRVFMGFDPRRLENSQSAAGLYIYSRESGRLIKKETDGRSTLGLSTGSTQFCQGLTIIVDDYTSHLPLNPTKTDVAFGEHHYGENHEKNFDAWVGAAAYAYWTHHFSKFKDRFMNPQELIYSAVRSFLPELNDPIAFKPMGQADFTKILFSSWSVRGGRIRIEKRVGYSMPEGHDTLWKIADEPVGHAIPKAPKTLGAPTPMLVASGNRSSRVTPSTEGRRPSKKRRMSSENNEDGGNDDSSVVDELQTENRNLQQQCLKLQRENQQLREKLEKAKDSANDEDLMRRLEQAEDDRDFHMEENVKLNYKINKLQDLLETKEKQIRLSMRKSKTAAI